jgi:hypothetical protein
VSNLGQPLTDEVHSEKSSIFPRKCQGQENAEVKLTILISHGHNNLFTQQY